MCVERGSYGGKRAFEIVVVFIFACTCLILANGAAVVLIRDSHDGMYVIVLYGLAVVQLDQELLDLAKVEQVVSIRIIRG